MSHAHPERGVVSNTEEPAESMMEENISESEEETRPTKKIKLCYRNPRTQTPVPSSTITAPETSSSPSTSPALAETTTATPRDKLLILPKSDVTNLRENNGILRSHNLSLMNKVNQLRVERENLRQDRLQVARLQEENATLRSACLEFARQERIMMSSAEQMRLQYRMHLAQLVQHIDGGTQDENPTTDRRTSRDTADQNTTRDEVDASEPDTRDNDDKDGDETEDEEMALD